MTVLILVLELVFCSKAQAGEGHQAQYTGDKGRRWGRANPNLFPCSYNSESEREGLENICSKLDRYMGNDLTLDQLRNWQNSSPKFYFIMLKGRL